MRSNPIGLLLGSSCLWLKGIYSKKEISGKATRGGAIQEHTYLSSRSLWFAFLEANSRYSLISAAALSFRPSR